MNPRVLVVDDNSDIVTLLERRLKAKGYDTLAAHNASAALALLETNRVDIAILDVMMPGISGYDMVKLINEKFENPPPIILYSAIDDVDERVKGKEARAYTYVVKSPTGSLLLDAIRTALDSCGRKILV